jgi:hypothetical protein
VIRRWFHVGYPVFSIDMSAFGRKQPLKPLLLNAFSTAFKNSALQAQNDDFPLFGHYLTFIYAGIAV